MDWKGDFIKILDKYIGAPNETFLYNGKWHTSKTFAAEYIKDKSTDFIGLTSFTDHPYYTSFIIDETHNYNGKTYSNLPLSEFIETVKTCIANGYTLIWDTDITNAGFQNTKGFAMWVNSKSESNLLPDFTEKPYNKKIRQQLYDRGITQDDHLMQITGLAKDMAGKEFFIVKNSWGNLGPFNGYIYVSVPYFAINTISVLVNKKALPAAITSKLSVCK